MNYEQGILDGANCHPLLENPVKLWKSGDPAKAWAEAKPLIRKGAELSPHFSAEDWLFLCDLAAICGLYEHSRIATARGYKQHPNDPMLGLIHVWDLSAKSKFFDCIEQLKTLRGNSNINPATLMAIECYNYSHVGWRQSATKAHKKTMELGVDDALTWYVLSRAASLRAEWELSVEAGEKSLSLCPKWSRVRSALTDSLLALGDLDRANDLLAETSLAPYSGIDFSQALCAEASGDLEKCKDQLKIMLERWPTKSRTNRFASRHLALLYLKDEKFDEAKQVIQEYRLRRFDELDLKTGSQNFIPIPLVSQEFNHCVPTVAAMVSCAQGIKVKPIELAKKMLTRHGTPIHRMIAEMKKLGFEAECVKVEPEIVEKFLDQGIPLIGVLTSLFSSHVDVICGYHAGMKLFHLRDPMHWFGYSIPYDQLKKHYHESGGLWALVLKKNLHGFEIKDEWRDRPGQAMIDLQLACLTGNLSEAEEAFKVIPDDHELASIRDSRGNCVVITPKTFEENLTRYAQIPDGERITVGNLRAMLSRISDTTADEIMEIAKSQDLDLAQHFIDYIEAQCLMAKHDWEKARKLFVRLARLSPGMEQIWDQLATVQMQLGLLKDARISLAHAVDIAPDDDRLQDRILQIEGNNLTFKQRLKQVQEMMEREPEQRVMLYKLSHVLRDSDDGRAWEAAIQDCIKYYPRDPENYRELVNWYLMQGRTDLAREAVKPARQFFDEDEFPLYNFEREGELPGSNETPSKDRNATSKSSDKESQTPNATGEDKGQGRFEELMSQVYEKMDASETPVTWNELTKFKEIPKLTQIYRSGTLTWWNSVRLLAMLVSTLLDDQTLAADEKASKLEKTLPFKRIPGIPERFAAALIDMIPSRIESKSAAVLANWIEKVCKQRNQFAELQFNHAFLLELTGRNNESEAELREIVDRHPAYAPVYFRLGQIFADRRDYQTAIQYHKQCLEITPGNFGAIDELVHLTRHLQTPDHIDWLERQRKLMPYSRQCILDLAMAIANQSGPSEAIKAIESFTSFVTAEDAKLLEGRLLVDLKEFDAAEKLIQNVRPSEPNKMLHEWIVIDCLVEKEKFSELRPRLEALLKDRPDDPDLIDQYVRVLRALDLKSARSYAESKLVDGVVMPILCHVALNESHNPLNRAQDIFGKTKKDDRERLVQCFAEIFTHQDYLETYIPFLKWATKEFPKLQNLRESLALRLNLIGDDKNAETISKKLLDEDPENPRYIRLYGICIQDTRPKDSIGFLKKEFEITGSGETLCRLGRGYQLLNNATEAKKYYQRALDVNPYETLAITNLAWRYKQLDRKIHDSIAGAIERGYGYDDQYFHVIAVKSALKHGLQLPLEWFHGALDRYQAALVEGGFEDEVPMLRKFLLAWAVKHKHDQIANQLGGFFDKLAVRFWWPKTAWIPNVGS